LQPPGERRNGSLGFPLNPYLGNFNRAVRKPLQPLKLLLTKSPVRSVHTVRFNI